MYDETLLVGGDGRMGLVALAQAAEVQVAVAANFTAPMQKIAPLFEAETGHKAVLAFGSTGRFYAQIRNGAPFDLLLAADDETPARLEREGLGAGRGTYAIGKLVLWSKQPGLVDDRGEVLRSGRFDKIALADPKLAPYGAAAIEALTQLGVLDTLRPRMCRARTSPRPGSSSPPKMPSWVRGPVPGLGRWQAQGRLGLAGAAQSAQPPAPGPDPAQQGAQQCRRQALPVPARRQGARHHPGLRLRLLSRCRYPWPLFLTRPMPLSAEAWQAIWLTVELATLTTVLLLLIATPLAWWLSGTASRWRAPVSALVTLPLVLPPSVLGFYLLVALGPHGPLGQLTQALGWGVLSFTFTGLLIGSIVFSLPFAVQPLQHAFEALGPRPLKWPPGAPARSTPSSPWPCRRPAVAC